VRERDNMADFWGLEVAERRKRDKQVQRVGWYGDANVKGVNLM